MAQADFYVLPAAAPEARSRFLCRLVEKIQGLGHQIYIHCQDESDAEAVDQLLWEFRPDAFLPHSLIGQRPEDSPIRLGWGNHRPNQQQVFINLALDIPDDALQFERILEVVVQTPDVLDATRRNYKRYQDNGIEIRMNDMRKKR
ncbi:DNA polymerase III subunit chi [Marinobacterium jannaschii]|uniref:DNA polymerase III subunit chi n=1 Tax=Marinobacterium jannaschii TaxID=64970 RepID=UPI00047F8AB8|nr:DNA polymerase III subunit chi [Marinobacterium jannaschii]